MNRCHPDSWNFDNWGRLKSDKSDSVLDIIQNDEADNPEESIEEETDRIKCDLCDKTFSNWSSQRQHRMRKHGSRRPQNDTEDKSVSEEEIDIVLPKITKR
jgi:hypothetical protein